MNIKTHLFNTMIIAGIVYALILITIVDSLPVIALLYICLTIWGFYIGVVVYDWYRDHKKVEQEDVKSL